MISLLKAGLTFSGRKTDFPAYSDAAIISAYANIHQTQTVPGEDGGIKSGWIFLKKFL